MLTDTLWRIRRPPNSTETSQLEDFPPIHQSLLLSRGLRSSIDAERFLNAKEPVYHDPFLLHGMDAAVERILKAIDEDEKVCFYADYDADGITGAALLTNYFRDNNLVSDIYFPDRFQEGYGLNPMAIRRLHERGVQLLITIDCGIRAVAEVDQANAQGMDVIVTDHHLPGDDQPKSLSTINPKLPGDNYPFKELAGVSLVYKLVSALGSRMKGTQKSEGYLDLAAIGTVADMAPLVGENRHIVQQGLARINDTPRIGIKALIDVAGYRSGNINASSIGFGLGPRINASGRLSSADLAFDLLTQVDLDHAQRQAEALDRLNKERQVLTADVVNKVNEQPNLGAEKVILSFDPDYHQGVVGLAASRLSDQYFRPAIIGKIDQDETHASARSIPGFHITQALEESSDLLKRFGGHTAAAGLTVENTNRERFIDRILEIANRSITEDQLQPVINIDACIDFFAITRELMAFLDALEPFGVQNHQPLFCTSSVKVLAKRRVGKDGAHLKLTLENRGRPFDAIAFRKGHLAQNLPEKVEVAFHVERNNYLGYESLQLRVVDIRPDHSFDDRNLTDWVAVV